MPASPIISIVGYFAKLLASSKLAKIWFLKLILNEKVAEGNASNPRDFIIQGLNVYLSYFPRIKNFQIESG